MRINPAPILLVHRGPSSIREVSRQVRTGAPERSFVDHVGQQHRIWTITDRAQLDVIDRGLADAHLLVADGHHRYAAYIALNAEEPCPADQHGLAMVIDHDETPLFLGAIHRLFHGVRLGDLVAAAESVGGTTATVSQEEAMSALGPSTLVLTDGQTWSTVALDVPSGQAMVQIVDDVVVTRLARRPSRIGFAHSVTAAVQKARPGRVTAAMLPAVDLDVIVDIVGAGGLLPEKATSFQPKPSLGAFIRLLDE